MLRTWFVFGRLRALAPDSASGVKANLYKLQNKQVLVILFSLDLSNTGIEKEKNGVFKRVLLEPCYFLVFLPFFGPALDPEPPSNSGSGSTQKGSGPSFATGVQTRLYSTVTAQSQRLSIFRDRI